MDMYLILCLLLENLWRPLFLYTIFPQDRSPSIAIYVACCSTRCPLGPRTVPWATTGRNSTTPHEPKWLPQWLTPSSKLPPHGITLSPSCGGKGFRLKGLEDPGVERGEAGWGSREWWGLWQLGAVRPHPRRQKLNSQGCGQAHMQIPLCKISYFIQRSHKSKFLCELSQFLHLGVLPCFIFGILMLWHLGLCWPAGTVLPGYSSS